MAILTKAERKEWEREFLVAMEILQELRLRTKIMSRFDDQLRASIDAIKLAKNTLLLDDESWAIQNT